MPFKEKTRVSLRTEFCLLANQPGCNIRELCRRFTISPKTGYKWLKRFSEEGVTGLKDRSRRPRRSPNSTTHLVEERIIAVRQQHPAWGALKIHALLTARGDEALPHPSTINRILKRRGYISKQASSQATPWKRFEYEAPNACWQMDFKGYFQTDSGICHPLDLLDDHSRYCLCLEACSNQTGETVKTKLISVFRQYGLPKSMLMDNGSPWNRRPQHPHSALSIWFTRLGIRVMHGRPRHPQTQGKLERFHRTLELEVLQDHHFDNLQVCQKAFDEWRDCYNLERPHEAIDMKPPVSRYQPSNRNYPEHLPDVVYLDSDDIYQVNLNGMIQFQGREWKVTKGLIKERVAVRPLTTDGEFGIYYGGLKLREINLKTTQ